MGAGDKRAEQRERITAEIINSEKIYVQNMQILLKVFLYPLREGAIVKQQIIADIFSNIEVLCNFHSNFLLGELASDPSASGFASVFCKYADFLKMYTQYVNGYDKCLRSINNLSGNKKFQQFLSKARNDPAAKGMDLMSYLIMPVQRIPRYELLLRELRKNLDPGSADITKLESAMDKIGVIAQSINESKREAERVSKLLETRSKLSGDDKLKASLVQPERILRKEGELVKKSDWKKKRLVYLFNDLLLWCHTSGKVRGYLTMDQVTVIDVGADVQNDKDTGLGIDIRHPSHKNVIHFFAKDQADKQAWLRAFKSAVIEAQTGVPPHQQQSMLRSISHGPIQPAKLSQHEDEKDTDKGRGPRGSISQHSHGSPSKIGRHSRHRSISSKHSAPDRRKNSYSHSLSRGSLGANSNGASGGEGGPMQPPPKIVPDSEQRAGLDRAIKRLQAVSRGEFSSLKRMKNPPACVRKVLEAAVILLGTKPAVRRDDRTGQVMLTNYWIPAQRLLSSPSFQRQLIAHGRNGSLMSEQGVQTLEEGYLRNELLQPKIVRRSSKPAAVVWAYVKAVYTAQTGRACPKIIESQQGLSAASLDGGPGTPPRQPKSVGGSTNSYLSKQRRARERKGNNKKRPKKRVNKTSSASQASGGGVGSSRRGQLQQRRRPTRGHRRNASLGVAGRTRAGRKVSTASTGSTRTTAKASGVAKRREKAKGASGGLHGVSETQTARNDNEGGDSGEAGGIFMKAHARKQQQEQETRKTGAKNGVRKGSQTSSAGSKGKRIRQRKQPQQEKQPQQVKPLHKIEETRKQQQKHHSGRSPARKTSALRLGRTLPASPASWSRSHKRSESLAALAAAAKAKEQGSVTTTTTDNNNNNNNTNHSNNNGSSSSGTAALTSPTSTRRQLASSSASQHGRSPSMVVKSMSPLRPSASKRRHARSPSAAVKTSSSSASRGGLRKERKNRPKRVGKGNPPPRFRASQTMRLPSVRKKHAGVSNGVQGLRKRTTSSNRSNSSLAGGTRVAGLGGTPGDRIGKEGASPTSTTVALASSATTKRREGRKLRQRPQSAFSSPSSGTVHRDVVCADADVTLVYSEGEFDYEETTC